MFNFENKHIHQVWWLISCPPFYLQFTSKTVLCSWMTKNVGVDTFNKLNDSEGCFKMVVEHWQLIAWVIPKLMTVKERNRGRSDKIPRYHSVSFLFLVCRWCHRTSLLYIKNSDLPRGSCRDILWDYFTEYDN